MYATNLLVLTCRVALAADGSSPEAASDQADKRPTKIWNRTGPLGETPKHVTDAYPLSDQDNKGGWVKFEPMTRRVRGPGTRSQQVEPWHVLVEGTATGPVQRQERHGVGRQVAPDDAEGEVACRSGEAGVQGLHRAALHTKVRSGYGYYEVKAKPMNSGGSSSFWFQVEDVPGWLTEIDVFEIGGKAKGFEHKYHMTLHVFKTPQENKHWSVGGVWEAPWRLADDYHVYGLDWGKDELKFYVDGVLVRSVENTHWHQPLFLIFDSETMPQWFGMPDDNDLPSTFSVEYVRAWKQKQ